MAYQSVHTGNNIDDAVSEHDNLRQIILDTIYPIGSLYTSFNAANPSSIIGGTWEQIKDCFLIAAGDSYAVGSTGGSVNHTHTTRDHTLTEAEMPKHNHVEYMPAQGYPGWSTYTTTGYCVAISYNGINSYFGPGETLYRATTGACGVTTDSAGGGASHNHGDTGSSSNLPPYKAIYMWQRTA